MELYSMLYVSLDGKGVWGENGYMYMYDWVPLLSTWNYHNIVKQLYPNQNWSLKCEHTLFISFCEPHEQYEKAKFFWTLVLEKTLQSPLDCKEIKPVHPKGNQPWIFIGRTDAEAETPIL